MDIKIFGQHKSATPTVTPPTLLADAGSETNADTEINLTWAKSVDGVMTNYRVYVGGILQQTFGDVALGTLTGLIQGATYSNITVRAWDGTTESADSNSINVTTETLYGPELVTEGDFSNGGAGWTLGAQTTIVSEECVITNGVAEVDILRQAAVTEVGKFYKVQFEIVAGSYVEGGIYVRRPSTGTATASSEGLHVFNNLEAIGTIFILRSIGATTNLTIDNVSVKEVL